MPRPTTSWPPPAWSMASPPAPAWASLDMPQPRNPAPLPDDEAGMHAHYLPYTTRLSPEREREFHQWLSVSKAPFDASPRSDYDMRGFWLALRNGDPRATTAINPADRQPHFPDTWKTPYHESFSDESIYAGPDAPSWHDDVLVDKHGRVIVDERTGVR